MPSANAFGPDFEFLPGPLEPVVGVTEFVGPDNLLGHLVLPVRGGEHDRLGPVELEQGPLEGREPGRVGVLDNLDGVELLKPLVPVGERPVEQFDPGRLTLWEPVQPEPVSPDSGKRSSSG